MDAGYGLLGILRVHFVFRLAILFRDDEDAQGLEGFERICGFRMKHAESEKEVICAKDERKQRQGGDQDAFREDAWRKLFRKRPLQ